MNKARIDENIEVAYKALADKNVEIAVNGQVQKAFRSQISSFGAALSAGSLLSAIAFFSDDGRAKVERSRLMKAIMILVAENHDGVDANQSLFDYVRQRYGEKQDRARLKEEILDYALALKLAMNLYDLT